MKKTLSVLLLFALVFSLCACGAANNEPAATPEPTPTPTPEPTPEPTPGPYDILYEKYPEIFDVLLEAEDFESAVKEISGMLPEPGKTVVTINPENFEDYYEINYVESGIDRDAEGKITQIWPRTYFTYKLKDEYMSKLVSDETYVEVGVTCKCPLKKIEKINSKTGELTFSKNAQGEIFKKINQNMNPKLNINFSSTFSGTGYLNVFNTGILGHSAFRLEKYDYGSYWTSGYIETNSKTTYYMFVPQDIKIVRAEGALTLLDN